jgi:hypothetical protein|eukprot:TRINITY_DN13778_c0_g1_i1.p1 TRINITY_DN13778_c0_g1~~TRINITY_DN13778_c0_g1_i1.p1  ORF type:complete len:516 (-),score=100.42 TRINITY_DN13778_c0_g1_i1:1011-2492(-)
MENAGENERNAFSAPPGLALDTISTSAAEDGGLRRETADALMEALKMTVAEKVEEIWQRGRRAMNQSQQRQAEQIEKLSAEVSACLERQKQLEDENEQLKQTLAKVTERFSMVGALFGAMPAVAAVPQKTDDALANSKSAGSPPRLGDNSSDDNRTFSTATPGTRRTLSDMFSPPSSLPRGSTPSDRLPDVPAFPFSSTQVAVTPATPSPVQQTTVATPLVLSEAVPPSIVTQATASSSSASVSTAADKPQTTPTQLSLESSIPPISASASAAAAAASTGAEKDALVHQANQYSKHILAAGARHHELAGGIFSFQLRKADNTELGLTVSHTECDRYLRVEIVRPDGAVESWNRLCVDSGFPEKMVVRGDLIISVNGITQETERMLQECKDKVLLKIVICRGVDEHRLTVPSSPVPSTSVATPGAQAKTLPCTPTIVEHESAPPLSTNSSLRSDAAVFVPLRSETSVSLDTTEEASSSSAALDSVEKKTFQKQM